MSGPLAPVRRGARGRPSSFERVRVELAARLEARRPEIEQAALTRTYAISDPAETEDPEYAEGLRAALSAALDYGLVAIEGGEERTPPPPPVLLVQARLAARAGVSLDTVLRRYFAGYSLLSDFLIEEAERADLLRDAGLKRLLRTQATLFDRLLAVIAEEHARETRERPVSSEQRRIEQVERLLAGELLDVASLAYDFEACHLGMIAQGDGAGEAIRGLSGALDRRLIAVHRAEDTVWAWFGGRRGIDPEELERIVTETWPAHLSLSIGEPAQGLGGWRLTHQQAKAALPIALRGSRVLTRYADVALLASMLQDDLLASTLRTLYLAPLERGKDGGAVARETLHAYFSAGFNVSSAAADLGVNRNTVASRIQAIEASIGRPLRSCMAEVEAALRLDELTDPTRPSLADTAVR